MCWQYAEQAQWVGIGMLVFEHTWGAGFETTRKKL